MELAYVGAGRNAFSIQGPRPPGDLLGGSGFQILVWMLCGLSSHRHFSFWSPTLPGTAASHPPFSAVSLSPAVQPLHPASHSNSPQGCCQSQFQGKLVYGILKCVVEKLFCLQSLWEKPDALRPFMCKCASSSPIVVGICSFSPASLTRGSDRQEGPFSLETHHRQPDLQCPGCSPPFPRRGSVSPLVPHRLLLWHCPPGHCMGVRCRSGAAALCPSVLKQ